MLSHRFTNMSHIGIATFYLLIKLCLLRYYSTQHLSAKSDVFSFGVVLLEIVSGREPLNINRPRNEWSLVEWVRSYAFVSSILISYT